MKSSELKSTAILALIFASRMLGLFMVLPVLALYGEKLPGATASLIGLAAGIYGFTQALLQLPLGILSDYYGRKPVIVGGLLVFATGSLIAAFSGSIWGLILGRAIQGAGAIGACVLALVADVTSPQVRTRAMAMIGMSIGATFVLAIILGPLVEAYWGFSAIFILTALLALLGILLLSGIKAPQITHRPQPFDFFVAIKNLWYLHINIFILHAMLMASFLILPLKIEEMTSFGSAQVWRFYIPVLLGSLLLVAPLLRLADKQRLQKKLLTGSLITLTAAIWGFTHFGQLSVFCVMVVLFFAAFNMLEASLPAIVSRLAPVESKGSTMGVYSFSQFLGMFTGGVLGGSIIEWMGPNGVSLLCFGLAFVALSALQFSESKEFEYGKRY